MYTLDSFDYFECSVISRKLTKYHLRDLSSVLGSIQRKLQRTCILKFLIQDHSDVNE